MVRTKSLETFVGCSCPKYRNFVPNVHFPCDMRIEHYVSPKRELHLQDIIPNPNKSFSTKISLVLGYAHRYQRNKTNFDTTRPVTLQTSHSPSSGVPYLGFASQTHHIRLNPSSRVYHKPQWFPSRCSSIERSIHQYNTRSRQQNLNRGKKPGTTRHNHERNRKHSRLKITTIDVHQERGKHRRGDGV
jgi:hypothetical protein